MNNTSLDLKQLPQNWKWVKLEDIAEGVNGIVDGPFGSNLKTSDYINDSKNGVPVLTTKNLQGDYSETAVRYISKEKFETIKRSQVNPGDIIVAKIGSIGKTGIYPKSSKTGIIPANLLKFTVSSKVVFKYVYFYLNSEGFQRKIKAISKATAQPAFNVTKFRKLEIPLPPYSTQLDVVSKIEELLSELDKGIEYLSLAQQQLKTYRQAVLKWAFEEKFTKSDKKWNYKSFKSCLTFSQGIQVDANLQSRTPKLGHVQFLRIIDFTQVNDEHRFIRNPGDRYFIKKDEVALVRYGATTGFVCSGKEGVIANNLFKVTPKDKILNRYLFYFLKSPLFQNKIAKNLKGAAMPAISFGLINDVVLPFPTIEEQNRIIEEIENRINSADKMEECTKQSQLQLEAMRQSILKKAFKGKLS